jgi:hypothetical protein
MRKRTEVLVASVVLAGVAAVSTWVSLAACEPVSLRISVRHVGHTNDSTGAGFSTFQVSNASPCVAVVGQSASIEFDSPDLSSEPTAGKYTILRPAEREQKWGEDPPTANRARWRLTLWCEPKEIKKTIYLTTFILLNSQRYQPTTRQQL